jgi:hypothetical protein
VIRRYVLAALAIVTATSAASALAAGGGSCVDAVLARVAVSNPDEACRQVGERRDPRAPSNFSQRFDVSVQDLGDGTPVYVIQGRRGADPYAYVPSFHFVAAGGRLQLVFDAKGAPSSYVTDRPKVNGRWQIERVLEANIPSLYRKREVETWFWEGGQYVKAFSRVHVEGAQDAKRNGTRLVWNPATREAYQEAGDRWTYTVQSGDTLSGIARKKGVSSAEIARQNGVRDAGSLRIGQVLRYASWEVYAR